MERLNFEIKIKASKEKVWEVLWTDATYRKWTTAFGEEGHAVSDWKEGSSIHFLAGSGDGMYSVIEKSVANEFMSFKHLGVVKNKVEQPLDDETKLWSGSLENYTLTETDGVTTLLTEIDVVEKYLDFFNEKFPIALQSVKDLSESKITVKTIVDADAEKVWKYWVEPDHITNWYFASDDWHAPRATNDLRVGGKFLTRMEAKDGSFGFDLGGTYNVVEANRHIEYDLADGRNVKIDFVKTDGKIEVIETFEPETTNSIELQRGGWQAILDNFKKYTESN